MDKYRRRRALRKNIFGSLAAAACVFSFGVVGGLEQFRLPLGTGTLLIFGGLLLAGLFGALAKR